MQYVLEEALIPIGGGSCVFGGVVRFVRFVTTRVAVVSVSASLGILAVLAGLYCRNECRDPYGRERFCPGESDPVDDLMELDF